MSGRQPASSFADIPGTVVFTGDLCRKGYALNQFCMSLMRAENRIAFKADPVGFMDGKGLSEDQRAAVLARDFKAMLALGGNIFFILKLAATDGRSTQSVVASIAGQTQEAYAAMMLAGGRQPTHLAA
jgi:protocatechuate 4,5-dioxygenase alpha chain